MASLLPLPVLKITDINDVPLSGGLVYTYQAGTNTPLTAYKDQAGTVAHTNPIVLDASGEAVIWLVGSYKINVTDYLGVQQPNWPVDNIQDIATQIGGAYGNINNIYAGTAAGTANQLSVTPSPAITSIPVGQTVRVRIFQNNTGGATLNIGTGDIAIRKRVNGALVPLDPNDLVANQLVQFDYDGTFWEVNAGVPYQKEVSVASAGTVSLASGGSHNYNITGTTGIASFGTSGNISNPFYYIRFTDALTLTNGASLALPGGVNIATAAGDFATVEDLGSNNWRVVNYSKASGYPAVTPPTLNMGTVVAATTGTAIDFTAIPAGVKRVTLTFSNISTSGTSALLVQLGDSGGIETAGYTGSSTTLGSTSANSTAFPASGFQVGASSTATFMYEGNLVFVLHDGAINRWSLSGLLSLSNTNQTYLLAGSKTLSAVLDRLRITTVGGTDTFDSGSFNIIYES